MNEQTLQTLTRLPLWLRQKLNDCPHAGDGVHQWIFATARHLLPHFDKQTTYQLLWNGAKDSGRPWGKLRGEIVSQIKNALPRRWQPRYPHTFKPADTPLPEEPRPTRRERRG